MLLIYLNFSIHSFGSISLTCIAFSGNWTYLVLKTGRWTQKNIIKGFFFGRLHNLASKVAMYYNMTYIICKWMLIHWLIFLENCVIWAIRTDFLFFHYLLLFIIPIQSDSAIFIMDMLCGRWFHYNIYSKILCKIRLWVKVLRVHTVKKYSMWLRKVWGKKKELGHKTLHM